MHAARDRSSSTGRKGYPPEFRRRVIDLVEAGRPVADVARGLEISRQSIDAWRPQYRIDKGLEPGSTSRDRSELTTANRRTRWACSPRASSKLAHNPSTQHDRIQKLDSTERGAHQSLHQPRVDRS